MEIVVHKGTHSVGGSVVEIKTSKSRIVLDFGLNLPSAELNEEKLEIEGLTKGEASYDAVFFSHYHGDHVGEYERILPKIPIYMGKVSKEIFSIVQKRMNPKGNIKVIDEFVTYSAGEAIQIGDIKITPHSVDHSAFDSYAFLIEAENKRILYTGDFRMHGPRGGKMGYMLEKHCKNIDILISEGTTLTRDEEVLTHTQLGKKAYEMIRDNKNVFVLTSSTDIDSIAKFFELSRACRKPFLICEKAYQGEILKTITENSKSRFYKFHEKEIYSYPFGKKLKGYIEDKGFVFLIRANDKFKEVLKEYPASTLIFSMWEGYLDKDNPAYSESIASFIEEANANSFNIEHLHTSGHAIKADIEKLIKITTPKVIIPVHGDNPEAFNEIKGSAEVLINEDGEVITF